MSSSVVNWYSGKNILITGSTGFIGKVFLEKLLRSCPEIGEIYLFIRPKNGQSSDERKNAILENILFENLRNINPKQYSKVRVINATLSKSELELNPTDEEYLRENCNLVFHIAAKVQFDLELRDITETNIWGLKHMLEFSKSMNNLKGFIFCSTAFSQHHGIDLNEIRYQPPIKPQNLDNILGKFGNEIINPLTVKLLGYHANTYAFTKSIAEELAFEYSKYFPISIARPSIVTNMAYDPLPGWTEGLHGFNGWFIVGLLGILKVVNADDSNPRATVPVDIASNALIIIGWKLGTNRIKDRIEYYNVAEDIKTSKNHMCREAAIYANAAAERYPIDIAVMHFGYVVTQNYIIFKILEIWYHFIPAILIDMLLKLLRKKSTLLRIHRKIIYNMNQIKYYTCNRFAFKTEKFTNLSDTLSDEENKLFPINVEEAYNMDYFYNSQLGIRKYLLKQNLESLPGARRLQLILFILGRIIYGLIIYWCYNFIYVTIFGSQNK